MKNILNITFIFLSATCFADFTAYDGVVDTTFESSNYIFKHFHDWSWGTQESRDSMMNSHQDPFLLGNNYAYLLCINKKTKDTVFNLPTPAFTAFQVSENEEFIACISNIKLHNPYQIAIFSIEGSVVFKKHIAPTESKLNKREMDELIANFPEQATYLDSIGAIELVGDLYFVDFYRMNFPTVLGEAWDFLGRRKTKNHISSNFSQSVTNWIYWYSETKVNIEIFQNETGDFERITLNDPENERITLKTTKIKDEIFINPEMPPIYKYGGDTGLIEFINKNLTYPKENYVVGKVYVEFIVDTLGFVKNVKIKKGINKEMDKEAIRIVKLLTFIPGKIYDKPTEVKMTLPISFNLD
jgi:TonB family protein